MLDAFIIEEIRRKDRERSDDDRPVVELPLPMPRPPVHSDDDAPSDETPDRGVVIIDYSI